MCADGVEALDFLYARGAHEHRTSAIPPSCCSRERLRARRAEVLRQVKSDERLKVMRSSC